MVRVDSPDHLETPASLPTRWEAFVRQSGNPKIPTWEEAIHEALTPTEAEQFTSHLQRLMETG